MNPPFQNISHIWRIMNRLAERLRSIMADDDRHPRKQFSKPSTDRRNVGRKTKEKPARRHQRHFYDPSRPDDAEWSSDDVGLAELERHQNDTLNRVEEAEAAVAKERKRIEQLELRRKEVKAREEQRRMQLDEAAGLTPRKKNRLLYEKAVARVEGTALCRIEELERRFAHSDKIFELREARRNITTDEQREGEAAEKEMKYQREDVQNHPGDVGGE